MLEGHYVLLEFEGYQSASLNFIFREWLIFSLREVDPV